MIRRLTATVFSERALKPFLPFFFNPTPTTTATASAAMGEEEPPKTNTSAARSIEEPDVGIFCYISKLPGFRGILKQRYSDFIVNEVDLDGNVVHLTSMDVPSEMVQKRELKLPEKSDKSYTSEIESFRSLAGDVDADLLKDIIDKINSGSEEIETSFVLSPSSDKSHRTAVHNFFKEKMNFLPDPSSKCIRVRLESGSNQSKGRFSRKRKDRRDKPFDSRGSEDWPEHLRKFLRVPDSMPLYDILNEFQKGHSHMVVVVRQAKRVQRKRSLQKWKSFPHSNKSGRGARTKKWNRDIYSDILEIDGKPLPKVPEEEEAV